jgi:RsiW-degrading membrane proteinase PrsW (M82 family)
LSPECPKCHHILDESEEICPNCGAYIKDFNKDLDSERFTFTFFLTEAFISIFKPEEIKIEPDEAVYRKRPPKPMYRYLILAEVMVCLGLSLGYGNSWMRNIGLTIASFATPVVYVYWMMQNDRYEPEPKTFVVYLFGWGMMAGIISSYFNPTIAAYIGIGGAAFVEEPLKLLGVYLLSTGRRTGYEMNNHLDGMVYGAAAGAGFAALENMYYISTMVMRQGSPIISAILFRATTSFCHIAWTAIAGRSLGLARALKGWIHWTDFIPGLLIVIPLHFFWNSFPLMLRGWFILPITILILYRDVDMALKDEMHWGYESLAPDET